MTSGPAPPASKTELVACAAWTLGTTPRDVLGKSRFQAHVRARWAVWFVLHRRGCPYASIGRSFGHHHTSVMHAVREVRRRLPSDPSLEGLVLRLAALRDGDFLEQQRAHACKQRIPMLRGAAQPKDDFLWD